MEMNQFRPQLGNQQRRPLPSLLSDSLAMLYGTSFNNTFLMMTNILLTFLDSQLEKLSEEMESCRVLVHDKSEDIQQLLAEKDTLERRLFSSDLDQLQPVKDMQSEKASLEQRLAHLEQNNRETVQDIMMEKASLERRLSDMEKDSRQTVQELTEEKASLEQRLSDMEKYSRQTVQELTEEKARLERRLAGHEDDDHRMALEAKDQTIQTLSGQIVAVLQKA